MAPVYRDGVAQAAPVESRPFLEKHDAYADGDEQAELEIRAPKCPRSFLKSPGLINAIGLVLNLTIAAVVMATLIILRRPDACACNDGPWCK